MIHLNRKQTQELIDLIENTHWYFIATHINPSLVPKKYIRDLVKMGFTKSQIIKYPELAMQFGALSVYLKDNGSKLITFEKLRKIVKEKKFLPLSREEKFALQTVEERAMSDIKGLGNKISKITHQVLIEADQRKRHKYEEIIRDVAKEAIEKREGIKFITHQIRERTGDFARDLDRIGDFILHEAFDTGRALTIKKVHGGNSKVWKLVHQDACEHCKKLYLKNQKTWEPRIFTVNELLANGSNVGRNKKDWKAVIGPIHPWCKCYLEPLLPGYIWSSKSQRFVPDERLRDKNLFSGKIKVTVTKT